MGVETGASGKSFPGFGAIDEDLVPDADATRDIGEEDTRFNYIYVVIAILTSMTIGGIYLYSEGGIFYINASTHVNGSLTVDGWVNATYFNGTYYGDGSGLYDVPGSNASFNQSHTDTLYADISVTGDNASWNESYADTLYLEVAGDTATGNHTWGDNLCTCYGDAGCADSLICFNGSSLIIKVT